MIRREPTATKPARYFSERFGPSVKTIKRLARKHGWKMVTYNDSPNATVYLVEAQVNKFFLEKQNNA